MQKAVFMNKCQELVISHRRHTPKFKNLDLCIGMLGQILTK